MKLKKLKEIEILNHKIQVIWDKQRIGAWFEINGSKGCRIGIGCSQLKKSPNQVYDSLMHELSEFIHVVLCTRYDDMGADGDYKFFMNHKEFQSHNRILCDAYMQFFK